MSALRLDGVAALVTGGARGIGLATATALTQRGARVAIGDLDGEAAARAAAELQGEGLALDVADRQSFEAFVVAASDAIGPPGLLVNNAGIMPLGRFLDQDDATIAATISVNLEGVIHGMRAVLPGMVERREGHIVNVASMMGKLHVPGAAVYTATKHAVVGLGAAVRDELDGTGVSITTLLPTAVRTELVAGVPLGRGMPAVEPEQVADAIVDSCDSRAAEVHVPGWLAAYEPAMALAPGRVVGAVRRLLSHDRLLKDLDEASRAEYDARVRGE